MKQITKYVAVDGTEFKEATECADYEEMIATVDKIMAALPPVPENDGCNFANGGGFIQHDKKVLSHVRLTLLNLIKTKVDHRWVQETIDSEEVHPSYVGRLLDDYDLHPLGKAWYRFNCIDKLGREWGQPYYVEHPDRAEQVCINANS